MLNSIIFPTWSIALWSYIMIYSSSTLFLYNINFISNENKYKIDIMDSQDPSKSN